MRGSRRGPLSGSKPGHRAIFVHVSKLCLRRLCEGACLFVGVVGVDCQSDEEDRDEEDDDVYWRPVQKPISCHDCGLELAKELRYSYGMALRLPIWRPDRL